MTKTMAKVEKRKQRKMPAQIQEAALQEAFRFTKIHDDERRNLVRCVLVAYEVAKVQPLTKTQ